MQIYGKGVEITEPFRQYIEEKLGQVAKFHQSIISLRCDIRPDQHHHKGDVFSVEVILTIPQKVLRVTETRPDAREAVDLAAEKLLRQVRQVKEKRLSMRRLGRWFK